MSTIYCLYEPDVSYCSRRRLMHQVETIKHLSTSHLPPLARGSGDVWRAWPTNAADVVLMANSFWFIPHTTSTSAKNWEGKHPQTWRVYFTTKTNIFSEGIAVRLPFLQAAKLDREVSIASYLKQNLWHFAHSRVCTCDVCSVIGGPNTA